MNEVFRIRIRILEFWNRDTSLRSPAICSFLHDALIADNMLACPHEPNLLRTRFNNEFLRWTNSEASGPVNFKILHIDQT